MVPKGWRLIDRYWQEGRFHHVVFLRFNCDGSARHCKTTNARLGQDLAEAFRQRIPVIVMTAAGSEWIDTVGLLPENYEVTHVSPDKP